MKNWKPMASKSGRYITEKIMGINKKNKKKEKKRKPLKWWEYPVC